MRFRYRSEEEMKDSGVEWIGNIPKDWNIGAFKYLIDSIGNGTSATQIDSNTNYKVTRIETISAGVIDYNKVGNVEYFKGIENYKLNKGDILLSNINSLSMVGNCAIYNAEEEIYSGMNLLRITSKDNIKNEWMYYLIKSYYFNQSIKLVCKHAINQVSVPTGKIKDIRVPLISMMEQEKISNFLEEKTSRFNNIISKKEALIQTLEEAEKSLISEVVTGKVKVIKTSDGYELVERKKEEMKDSGVEWLGYVPKEWEIKKIKYVVSLKSGDSITSDNIRDEGAYPVYGGNGLRGYTDKYTHNGNYILIGRQGALCGNINYAENKFWASEHAVVVTPIKDVQLLWIGELFRSMNFNQYSISAAQPGLSVNAIQNLYMPYTKLEDQKIISNYIGIMLREINSIINNTINQIQKLKEAKQALISEAVTGKIEILD
jgi:type I restriction enzyme S subunit